MLSSAFSRLLEPLNRRLVARHEGERGVGQGENAWTCARHLKTLLFAQWSGLDSLRQIEVGLAGQRAAFYHLGLRAPCRSTLSDAAAQRPAAVFAEIAAGLAQKLADTLGGEGDSLVRLLDWAPIMVKGERFAWAEKSARIRGLKLHLLYDPRARRPVWFALSSAKVDDVVAGRAAPVEPGATLVFDKGYTDYRWWAEIIRAGGWFITRRKKNGHARPLGERPAEGAAILADRTIQVGHRRPKAGAPANPLYHTTLREVVVERDGGGAHLVLLTNDLDRPAAEIARLYKERWQIELFFKWLKQNLKIRRFLGRSENAVRTQVYAALIAFMLLRLLHATTAPAPRSSWRSSKSTCSARFTCATPAHPSHRQSPAATPPIPPRFPMTNPARSNPGQQCAKAGTHLSADGAVEGWARLSPGTPRGCGWLFTDQTAGGRGLRRSP